MTTNKTKTPCKHIASITDEDILDRPRWVQVRVSPRFVDYSKKGGMSMFTTDISLSPRFLKTVLRLNDGVETFGRLKHRQILDGAVKGFQQAHPEWSKRQKVVSFSGKVVVDDLTLCPEWKKGASAKEIQSVNEKLKMPLVFEREISGEDIDAAHQLKGRDNRVQFPKRLMERIEEQLGAPVVDVDYRVTILWDKEPPTGNPGPHKYDSDREYEGKEILPVWGGKDSEEYEGGGLYTLPDGTEATMLFRFE